MRPLVRRSVGWSLLAFGAGGVGVFVVGCAASSADDTFVGSIQAEMITTIEPDDSNDLRLFSLNAQVLPGSEWPACSLESFVRPENPCCFASGTAIAPGLSAGRLEVEAEEVLTSGEAAEIPFSLGFDADAGGYHSDAQPTVAGAEWYANEVTAKGDVVPAFSVSLLRFASPPPDLVVTPDLGELQTLSTSTDWTVPLSPSKSEAPCNDRVVLEVDGVGAIICQAMDQAAVLPPLVVPAALLAKFAGQHGTVSIYRDWYGFADGGSLFVGFWSGNGIRTAHGAVSFGP